METSLLEMFKQRLGVVVVLNRVLDSMALEVPVPTVSFCIRGQSPSLLLFLALLFETWLADGLVKKVLSPLYRQLNRSSKRFDCIPHSFLLQLFLQAD